jgi:hypothetical protein
VFLNGSTGEGLSLTYNERLELCEEWSKIVDDDFKLIVHIGSNSLNEAKEFAPMQEKTVWTEYLPSGRFIRNHQVWKFWWRFVHR